MRFLFLAVITASLTGVLVAAEPPVSAKPEATDKAKLDKKKPPAPFAWVNPLPSKHQHPALKHSTFQSPSLGVDVGYAILLPPSYQSTQASKRYPVVYYLHGGRPGSEAKSVALAPMIYSEMESGNVGELIYVFVNGGPVSHYNMPDEPTKQGADVFIKELIPHIDATYRTIADRDHRGIEGFSQGGRGTMRLSLRHPDLFSSAAAGGGGYETERKISESGGQESETLVFAKGDNTWDLAKAYARRKSPAVKWLIYVGTQGFNYENNLAYMEFLKSLGIPFQKIIVPDVPHSGLQIYQQQCTEIMQFHAKNLGATKLDA
ncbi:alpha/beta hydrolase [Stieleria varia]|uniref:alpha/beta hydrolase n=1 Tax=Stieleria varia TaxID=2528005 RepID=UPI0036F2C569